MGGQGHDYSNIGASPDENGPAFRPADMRPSATNGYIAFDNALHSPPDAGQGSGASRGRGRGRGYRGPTQAGPGRTEVVAKPVEEVGEELVIRVVEEGQGEEVGEVQEVEGDEERSMQ